MAKARVGVRYRYAGEQGLGEAARVADPELDDNLSSEMKDLDMPSGCVVTVDDLDFERDLVIVKWDDSNETPRRTSIEADHFESMFERVK
jgi:hypothetical protein